jgi:DNA-binding winged helix-turn-helix (wHTH) protein/tetratricopeptide (TPR) repeat protein
MRVPRVYEFADVCVEPDAFRLYKGGEQLHLEPKALETLVFLIDRRGRLVTRDELLDSVWKDTFVTPNALTRVIAQLRRALGDEAHAARFIETVPTRGYRFIARLKDDLVNEESGTSPSARSIAILPLKPLVVSGSGDEDYLGVGITDSLINRLSSIRDLEVRPTSAVLKYSHGQNISSIGHELRVAWVLDGSIHRAAGRVRVSVQLLRAEGAKLSWAEEYIVDFKEIFQLQQDISMRITEALSVQLTSNERESLVVRRTPSVDAYNLYLRGNFHLFRFTPDDHDKALEYFNRAIDLDPNYALAYSALAMAYLTRASFGADEEARLSEDAARKAIELDPTIAEAHSALAAVQFWFKRDLRASEESFTCALELSPSSVIVRHYYSWMLLATGRFEMAETLLRRALELDPMSPIANVDQGLPFFFARRYDLAIEHYERALRWAYEFWYAHLRLAEALECSGQFERAIEHFELAVELSGQDSSVRAELTRALALAGHEAEARRVLDEITSIDARKRCSPYFIALALLGLGEAEEAFQWLDRAVVEGDKWLAWATADPRVDTLRQDARFRAIITAAA